MRSRTVYVSGYGTLARYQQQLIYDKVLPTTDPRAIPTTDPFQQQILHSTTDPAKPATLFPPTHPGSFELVRRANYNYFKASDKCQASLNSGLTLVILDRT